MNEYLDALLEGLSDWENALKKRKVATIVACVLSLIVCIVLNVLYVGHTVPFWNVIFTVKMATANAICYGVFIGFIIGDTISKGSFFGGNS